MPLDLQGEAARQLFKASVEAGLLQWILANRAAAEAFDEAPRFVLQAGPQIGTKARLAYWCKRASSYLKLDRGRMQGTDEPRTNWKPFEAAFGVSGAPLRMCLHMIEESVAPEDLTQPIDDFFEGLPAHVAQASAAQPCGNDGTEALIRQLFATLEKQAAHLDRITRSAVALAEQKLKLQAELEALRSR